MKYNATVTTRIIFTKEYFEIRDAISHDLINYLNFQNVLPIVVPNNVEFCQNYLVNSNLLILSGGNDLSSISGLSVNDLTASKIRDDVETKLVDTAIKLNIPIIGICRGMQFLNNYFGGTLEKIKEPNFHKSGSHYVFFRNDSSISKKGDKLKVKSFHNFKIKELGKNLHLLADAEDGQIEAFKHSKLPIYGLMWHPEREMFLDSNNYNRNIIKRILGSK